ncbi:hypothetical protein [Breznakibacter xylanolyticus]|nr:hypothetical protein [Breznakibacter xylanolyticus]MBN2742315.1 hypothetical protein [Marinilabiliaceae bacterium]
MKSKDEGRERVVSLVSYMAMGLVLAGVLMQIGAIGGGLYVMAAGAIPFFVLRLFIRWRAPKDHARIRTVMVYSAMLLLVAVVAGYLNKPYWMLPVMVASMLEFYISFRLSKLVA